MLASRPPMGYNTWNTFGPKINEQILLEITDAFVEKGYRDAGYEYIVIDDCWSLRERNENGELVPNPEKFPHGMKYVADYIHSKGMKFGMYSCAGPRTCAGFPGSFDHEYQDARTFASWGVDFLKYDFCFFPKSASGKQRYLQMAMALRSTGRDIIFSGCNWGTDNPASWMRSIGAHMYRSTGDIVDTFASSEAIMKSQYNNFNNNAPGCFNDIDMLTVGMFGKGYAGREGHSNYNEYEMQFAYWCFAGAPLMIGADVRDIDDRSRALLQNPRLIELNQDPDCRPAYFVQETSFIYDCSCFLRHLSNNELAIGFFNFRPDESKAIVSFADFGIPYSSGVKLALTDVITGEDCGVRSDEMYLNIPGHTCRIFRARFVNP